MGKGKSMPLRLSRFDYIMAYQDTKNTPTKEERRVVWDRRAKQYLRSKGYIAPKIPSTWRWTLGAFESGTVMAHTRSEARSQIKKILAIHSHGRSPVGINLEKVAPC